MFFSSVSGNFNGWGQSPLTQLKTTFEFIPLYFLMFNHLLYVIGCLATPFHGHTIGSLILLRLSSLFSISSIKN